MEVLNDIMPSPGSYGYGTVLRALRTPFIDTWQGRSGEAKQDARLRKKVPTYFTQGRVYELFPGAGQGAGLIDEILAAAEIVRRMVTEARLALERSSELLT